MTREQAEVMAHMANHLVADGKDLGGYKQDACNHMALLAEHTIDKDEEVVWPVDVPRPSENGA